MTATQPVGLSQTNGLGQASGLSQDQMELVLRGLRFVRSSISMEVLNPSEATTARRSEQLRQVDGLVRQLAGAGERVPAGV